MQSKKMNFNLLHNIHFKPDVLYVRADTILSAKFHFIHS